MSPNVRMTGFGNLRQGDGFIQVSVAGHAKTGHPGPETKNRSFPAIFCGFHNGDGDGMGAAADFHQAYGIVGQAMNLLISGFAFSPSRNSSMNFINYLKEDSGIKG